MRYDIIDECLLVASPLAGSVIYTMCYDLYQVYVTKKQRWCRPFEYKQLINPGLVLGGLIGYARYHLGIPVLEYMLQNSN